MEIKDTYDSISDPFQGDRVLRLQSIPAGARIRRATATITPRSASPPPAEPFTEVIDFTSSPPVLWGAIRSTGQVPQIVSWAEVDFHARRTLAKVEGDHIQGCKLQADFGGVYVEINQVGGIKTPNANDDFVVGPFPADLPGLTITKFKLTGAPTAAPIIRKVTIRSVPTNISLRFGQMPAFWMRVGEMTQPETTPDFALALQAFVADAQAENGFYNVPLIIHSDSIARLQIDLNIEVVIEENALSGLNSVALPFNFSRAPGVATEVLQLALPMNSKLSPLASRALVTGNFAETRIAYDPMEKVAGQAGSPVGFLQSVAPIQKIRIAPNSAQAQPVSFDRELSATAIDLLLEVKETARLRLDLREDLDGKPGPASLLPKAVDFEVPGPVGLENPANSTALSKWTSIVLPAEFQFKASDAQTRRRYWIVVQSVEGEAQWSVAGAKDAPNLIERIGVQHTTADGLSWRESSAPQVIGGLTAFFRLRRKPERFEMPIALQIGAGEQAVRVSLDRFAPTGSVNLALNFDDFNKGLDEHLKKRAPICREASHLLNGGFQQWIGIKDAVPLSEVPTDQPAEWTLTAGSVKRYQASEGATSFAVLGLRISEGNSDGDVEEFQFEGLQSALSQVTPVIASCTYDFSFEAIASDDDAVAEIFWLGETCGAATPEPVRVPIQTLLQVSKNIPTVSISNADEFLKTGVSVLQLHRVRVTAPLATQQAEVRFSVPEGVLAIISNVSLVSTTETVVNGDFRMLEEKKPVGWALLSGSSQSLSTLSQPRATTFDNTQSTRDSFEIMQTIAIKPDQPFTLTVNKGETKLPATQGALPRVEVRWLKADNSKTGQPVVLELDAASFNARSASGASPSDAANAEIHIIIPPQAFQEIESISLGFPTRTIIPVTFVAQAPGELTISGWQIGFEGEPGTRPPIPPRGLCAPTPPGNRPGETSNDKCFCKGCGSHKPIVNAGMMETVSGTPALIGQCASCGDEMISFGGRPVAGATRLPVRGIITPQPIFITATAVAPTVAPITPAPALVETAPTPMAIADSQPIIQPPPGQSPPDQPAGAELPPITTVKGIGKQRAEQLVEHGIASLETLAAALPEQVAQVKGISEAQAAKLIAQAKTLVGAAQ